MFFSIGQRAGKVRGKGARFVLGRRGSELVVMGAKEQTRRVPDSYVSALYTGIRNFLRNMPEATARRDSTSRIM